MPKQTPDAAPTVAEILARLTEVESHLRAIREWALMMQKEALDG